MWNSKLDLDFFLKEIYALPKCSVIFLPEYRIFYLKFFSKSSIFQVNTKL